MAFDLEANNRFASDAFDCSCSQTPVSILRDEIEVSRDQSKLHARTAAVKNKDIHCFYPLTTSRRCSQEPDGRSPEPRLRSPPNEPHRENSLRRSYRCSRCPRAWRQTSHSRP